MEIKSGTVFFSDTRMVLKCFEIACGEELETCNYIFEGRH